MALEIERKFLVKGRQWQTHADGGRRIRQAYLSNNTKNTVRIRITDDSRAELTIKSGYRGFVRDEFEYPVPLEEARNLIQLRQSAVIDKIRYEVRCDGVVWEIDEFFGPNAGLVMAEVELESVNQTLRVPDWVGREVSRDKRYTNSQLATHPFTEWAHMPAK